jgi:hypothetical protein
MVSRVRRWLLFLCCVGTLLPAHALRVDGIAFDDVARVGGRELRLNGVGFRAVATIKGYAAGLYLAEAAHTPAEVTTLAGPKRLQLRMLLDVPSAEFAKAFRKGVERNTAAADLPALAERVQTFDKLVLSLGQMRKGDLVNLDFVPGQGLVLSVNGKVRGLPVPGEDLYAALLRSFVGDRPYDRELKAGLLGG